MTVGRPSRRWRASLGTSGSNSPAARWRQAARRDPRRSTGCSTPRRSLNRSHPWRRPTGSGRPTTWHGKVATRSRCGRSTWPSRRRRRHRGSRCTSTQSAARCCTRLRWPGSPVIRRRRSRRTGISPLRRRIRPNRCTKPDGSPRRMATTRRPPGCTAPQPMTGSRRAPTTRPSSPAARCDASRMPQRPTCRRRERSPTCSGGRSKPAMSLPSSGSSARATSPSGRRAGTPCSKSRRCSTRCSPT